MKIFSSYVKIDENLAEMDDEVNMIDETKARRVL